MKKFKCACFSLLILFLFSCVGKDPIIYDTKVLLLKVDFVTNEFEGGKEFMFEGETTALDSIPISSDYGAPGDFGFITLYYEPLDEMLFHGTIIWSGRGEMEYPENLTPPANYDLTNTPLPTPDSTVFQKIIYDEFAIYPDDINYTAIWNAINNLEIVSEYSAQNENGKIGLFLYTPSVGVGDINDWDWYVILDRISAGSNE